MGTKSNFLKDGGTFPARAVHKFFMLTAVLGLSIALSACTTSVLVQSEPPGADVEINGQSMGKTPVTITMSDFDFNVDRMTLSKLGYADKTVTLERELKVGPFIGGFFFWPFWLWSYGPMDTYNYRLDATAPVRVTPVSGKVAAETSAAGEDELERDMPETGRMDPNAVAVVIGITHYKNPDIPSVTYAQAGADLMREYFEKAFGIDKRKIIFATDENASLADFRKIFGEELGNYIVPGKSDVYIYYQGHGVPDPETKEAYLVPWDCDPSYARSTGYSLKEFYANLAKLPARSITVILDACFSGSSAGGMLLKNISPLYIQVKNPVVALKNAMVFTSSTGEQVSCWYPARKQSLFTYYFLKGLTGAADANKNGTITAGEMEKYLMQNVPVEARYLSNREQTPKLMTQDPSRVLLRYK